METLRWTLKISKDATFEEMQDAMRFATNNPNFQLDREYYEQFKGIDKVEREHREKMIKLLGPLYDQYADRNDAESIKRKKEINYILHYIQFAGDDDWKIIDITESPDFIIEVNGEKIGLELTGIYDQEVVAQVSKREQVCNKAMGYLRRKYQEVSKLINIRFNEEQSINLSIREMVPQLISYLEADMNGEKPELPVFLLSVDSKPHQGELQIVLAEMYLVKEINTKVLDELISQKEAKIEKYIENTGLHKIWLLVIIDGVSEKSAQEFTPEMLPQRKFAFDKVIVYNSFKQIGIISPPIEG